MKLGNTVEFIKSAPSYSDFLEKDLMQLAFAGRSNVGKSSLINKMMNMKHLAKVSQTPGKTKLLNIFKVDNSFLLVDLPGYGYAKVSKSMKKDWHEKINEYLIQARDRMLLVFLIDSRHSPQKKDLELYSFLMDNEIDFIIVATKIDKLSKNQLVKNLNILKKTFVTDNRLFFPVSSKTGAGISNLIEFIHSYIYQDKE
jgi:GTP-binding protein